MAPAVLRPRCRDLGIAPGSLAPGALNAITDVAGVGVGQVTLIEGEAVRTGVTAITPHADNPFQEKTPAGFASGNGFGKFAGSTQIEELGEIETPIVLTNTLSVAEALAGAISWTLARPGNGRVVSVNAVVGETNDGYLNDIRGRHVSPAHVVQAIAAASGGPVAEGCVGAGTGTQAFGWKGGIGTSSRLAAGFTLGVLVQTNYGGSLCVDGVAVGRLLHPPPKPRESEGDGSVVVVLATDAPLSDRNLRRLAGRAFLGLARTGSWMANGSGDYAIAFSAAEAVRRTPSRRKSAGPYPDLANEAMSPLFQAAVEATEEAVLNAMLQAVTTRGMNGRVLHAIPAAELHRVLRRHRPEVPPPERPHAPG